MYTYWLNLRCSQNRGIDSPGSASRKFWRASSATAKKLAQFLWVRRSPTYEVRQLPNSVVHYSFLPGFTNAGAIWHFPQQQNFAMGSLAQISSGAIRCSFNTRFRTRFRRLLVQIPREVPEGSGADTSWGSGGSRWRCRRVLCGSGGFRCRYLVRLREFPVQVLGEVPEGYGADTWLGLEGFGAGIWWGSGSFRCSYLMRFRRV